MPLRDHFHSPLDDQTSWERILEAWSHILAMGQPLPTLPLWLAENFYVPLELEVTYEQTCRILRIG
jgi:hypothetical protein